MFEFDNYDKSAHGQRLAPGPQGVASVPPAEVAEMSMLFWSEHCIERAVPNCLASFRVC
jgi:hypothetical protein